jgi:hypothetical protein
LLSRTKNEKERDALFKQAAKARHDAEVHAPKKMKHILAKVVALENELPTIMRSVSPILWWTHGTEFART